MKVSRMVFYKLSVLGSFVSYYMLVIQGGGGGADDYTFDPEGFCTL